MASATGYVYARNDSTSYFTVNATITWDNNNPYLITVSTSSSKGKYYTWQISGRHSQGDYTKYLTGCPMNSTRSFYGAQQSVKEYVFQVAGDGSETSGEYNNTAPDGTATGIFTVTFGSSGGGDSGGGTVSSYYVSYYDSDGDLLARTTEAAGYQFVVQSGSSVTRPTGSSTNDNYTITGDANGGTFSDGTTTASITATQTTTIVYNFSSWNTNSYGTGYTYHAGSYYTMPSYNLNLYPIFSSGPSISYSNNSLSRLPQPSNTSSTTTTLTATFNANGGSVSTTSQSVNATVTKTFGGWMNSSGTVITSLSSAGTVKAKWNNSYSNNTLVLPLPSRSGYNFNGWSTSTSGTNLQPAGKTVSITSNTTYYAIWTEKEKPKGGIFIHDGTKWQLATEYVFNEETWISSE